MTPGTGTIAVAVAALATRVLMGLGAFVAAVYAGERAPIQDNSFPVEEAYNQERRVVQHIATSTWLKDGSWLCREIPGQPGHDGREESLVAAPGLRWAYDLAAGPQIVPGVAIPIGLGPSRGERGVLLYVSVEHGF